MGRPNASFADKIAVHSVTIALETSGKGFFALTDRLQSAVRDSGLAQGTVTVFCQHTSCSLVIMESADPAARQDLQYFMEQLVPMDDPGYTHTSEGPDDMPSHIKMALTRTSEVIPFTAGQLLLGVWQGLFLWEHRMQPHTRHLVVTVMGTG